MKNSRDLVPAAAASRGAFSLNPSRPGLSFAQGPLAGYRQLRQTVRGGYGRFSCLNWSLASPTHLFFHLLLKRFRRDEMVMVGDRLSTDKLLAENAGIDFILVLSGAGRA